MTLRAGWLAALLLAVSLTAQAAPDFPALTGRVVDNAQMIDPPVRAQLSQQLQALEQTSGDQIVVVTVPDLQGTSIDDFGYQLGRHWGIGQKDKNNGALLIVARDERKLRIEVGYGLEERLTDAQSSIILNQVITPAFKNGQFSKGISDGVAAMLLVLGGSPLDEPVAGPSTRHSGILLFGLLILVVFVMLGGGGGRGRGRGGPGAIVGGILGGLASGGFGGGGGGGGFGGGGGSFGGGGASGGW